MVQCVFLCFRVRANESQLILNLAENKVMQSRVNVCLTQNTSHFLFTYTAHTNHNNVPQLTCQPNYEDDGGDDVQRDLREYFTLIPHLQ